jgi:hypothetical protein
MDAVAYTSLEGIARGLTTKNAAQTRAAFSIRQNSLVRASRLEL